MTWPRTPRAAPLLVLSAALVAAPGCKRCGDPPPARHDTAARALGSLPYITTTPVSEQDRAERMGVTLHDRARAFAGLTGYCSEDTDQFKLLDMTGKVVHRLTVKGAACRLVRPHPTGDWVMLGNGVLLRVGWDGQVRWRIHDPYRPDQAGAQNSFHHDVAARPDGSLLVLANHNRRVKVGRKTALLRDDEIVYVSAEGKLGKRMSVFDMLKPHIPKHLLDKLADRKTDPREPWDNGADLMHTNTLELLPADAPLGEGADLLLAARYLDLVAAVDLDRRRVTWSYGQRELQWPHHPILLGDKNILIFDNGAHRKASRVIKLDPVTRKVVWQYHAREGQPPFFTESRGSAQLLPHGNVLITESDTGRLFEVDASGRRVWEFWNPDLTEPDGKTPASRRLIYRATRYHPGNLGHRAFIKLWNATAGKSSVKN